jgi:opacity protein-like surface antigen
LNDNDTEAFGVQGTFARPVSETWSFQFDAGVARTDYRFTADDGSIVDNADSSFTFGAALEKETQLTTWTVGLGRTLDPNSNGFLSARDNLRVAVTHRFTQRLRTTAGLRGSRIDTPVEDAGTSDRDYWRASFEIEWAMTPRWMLTTGLDRVTEEFVEAGADATSNAVMVGVRYRGLSQQTAR